MKTFDLISIARPPTKKDFLSKQEFASRLLKHLISEGLVDIQPTYSTYFKDDISESENLILFPDS